MTPEHDEIENLVAAFVLGACDPGEAESARSHIEACASCRELSERLSRAVRAVPLATEEARPPERLRERILTAAAASPPAGARSGAPHARKVVWLPSRLPHPGRFRLPISWSAAAVAALAVGLVALAGWNVSLYRALNQPPAHYSLNGSGPMAGAQASVTAFSREEITLMSFRGMPQTPEGKVYEVWLIDSGGKAVPAAVFTPDAHGDYELVLTRGLDGSTAVAVTQEQGPNGVAQPTQPSQLVGRIA